MIDEFARFGVTESNVWRKVQSFYHAMHYSAN